MKKNKYIFRKATSFLVSLLLTLSAIDGYALRTIGIKSRPSYDGAPGVYFDPNNGGRIVVRQSGRTYSSPYYNYASNPPVAVTWNPGDTLIAGYVQPNPCDPPCNTNHYTHRIFLKQPYNFVNGGGAVTIYAEPFPGRRVVWYVNGFKLQGGTFAVYPKAGSYNAASNPSLTWTGFVTDPGTLGNSDAIWRVYAENASPLTSDPSGKNYGETLTIPSDRLSLVDDVQVEFINDIAHRAKITASSATNTSAPAAGGTRADNGHKGCMVVENTNAWTLSPADANAGKGNTTDYSKCTVTFDIGTHANSVMTNPYIERIDIRRKSGGNAKLKQAKVRVWATNGTLASYEYTVNFAPKDGNYISVMNGSLPNNGNPDGGDPSVNGDMDQVVYVTNNTGSGNVGYKPISRIEIKLVDWLPPGDGTSTYTGTDPQVGIDRVKIYAAHNPQQALLAVTVNSKVTNSRGGTIQPFTGGYINGCLGGYTAGNKGNQMDDTRMWNWFNSFHPGIYPTGGLLNSFAITGATGTSTGTSQAAHINDYLYFVANPETGWRVKHFIVTGYNRTGWSSAATKFANRVSFNYVTGRLDEGQEAAGNIMSERAHCLGVLGSNGSAWPLMSYGLSSVTGHSASSTTDVTTPNAQEIFGIPKTSLSSPFTMEVEFEKELALYSTVTASGEVHPGYNSPPAHKNAVENSGHGCKYGVAVGSGDWYTNNVSSSKGQWIDFKYNVAGKSVKEVRLYGRDGDTPDSVKIECYKGADYTSGTIQTQYTEEFKLKNYINVLKFCKAKCGDGIRFTTTKGGAAAGYQRIQIVETMQKITGITISPASASLITTPCGTLQFSVPAGGVVPANADYNQPPYFPYTWKVTDTSGNPTKLAAIDSEGKLYPLHKGDGTVHVFAEANDGYGTKSPATVVTLTGQPQVADTVLLTHNLNHLIASSITDVVVTATLKPTPETAYNKVIWEITPRPTLAKVVDATDPTNTALATNLIDGTTATTILQIKIMRPFLTPATNASMSIKATPVQYTPSCNFAASFKTALTTGGSVDLATKGPFLTAVGCNCSEAFPTPAPYTDAIKIRGDGATNTESPFIASLNLYPVPFATTIQITDAAGAVLQIKNIAGITILTQQISGANETLDLSQLASGMYFFCFEKDGQTKIVKAVKN